MAGVKRLIEYNGKTMTIPQWAKWQGISEVTLRYRIKAGWNTEEALNGKPRKTKRPTQRTDESLCWLCARTAANCPWVYKYRPITGWEAEQTVIRGDNGVEVTSYHVSKCPIYVPHKKLKGVST